MKRTAMVLGCVLLMGAMAIPAFGWGPRWGGDGEWACPGGGPFWGKGQGKAFKDASLTQEQQEQLNALRENFLRDTEATRREIWSKSEELKALMSEPYPDVEKAKALQQEISDLKGGLAQERLNLRLEAQKIAPEAGLCKGYGRGPGKGPGPRGGPGACPYR